MNDLEAQKARALGIKRIEILKFIKRTTIALRVYQMPARARSTIDISNCSKFVQPPGASNKTPGAVYVRIFAMFNLHDLCNEV